ncbi:MAG: 16S rRNA (guanine(966)-N(2))-methyltransferase RsmD [Bacilli bacterium]
MRVISGKLKGRVLKGYDILGTRPTMDRVKESLFASIQDYIQGRIVLDLFAGSGNLGIEAISNGCKKCYFVDYNRECIKVIKDNIKNFHIEDQCVVLERDYHEALKYFRDQHLMFDIIFIDPPYRYSVREELLKTILEYELLAEDGLVVFEYQNDEDIGKDISFSLIKNKKYGDKWISIYQKCINL